MNAKLLSQKVHESGYKYGFIAEKLGISQVGLIRKRNGNIPFKVSEINTITDLLSLTRDERDEIFGLKVHEKLD